MTIAEMRKICEAATEGPWYEGAQNDALYITAGEPPSLNNDYPRHDAKRIVIAKPYRDRDAAFIAAARTFLPLLLDVAEKAEKLNFYFKKYDGTCGAEHNPKLPESARKCSRCKILIELRAALAKLVSP